MKAKGCQLRYHSGGMRGPGYFTTEPAELDVQPGRKVPGVRGEVGPFLRVGDIYFTKHQALQLAQAIAEQAAAMGD